MGTPFFKQIYRKTAQFKRSNEFPYSRYNKTNNCIFIHIPKVAGTSIVNALGGEKAKRNHLPWYVYYTANPKFFNKAFKFSFVRNPWDRVLSAYQYLSCGGNQKDDLKISEALLKYKGFEDFVINGLGEGYFRSHLLFLPQADFVINGNEELAVDFLGYFENINDDFNKVMGELGIKRKLEKRNTSTRDKNYREYYQSQKSIEVIENIYKQDVIFFSYTF
jgi:hypothetical protein